MRSWLQDNDIDIYSTNNKSFVAIRTLLLEHSKNKIYKFMTLTSKNAYIDKLDDIRIFSREQ